MHVVVADKTWNHWNNALIPERTSLEQKQLAREARQAERERYLFYRSFIEKWCGLIHFAEELGFRHLLKEHLLASL